VALRVTFGAGLDETRMSFCGGGITGVISGSEADPTASSVAWRCEEEATVKRLTELERATDGSVQGPLIVPYVGRAIEAWRRGAIPGRCDELPSIGDVRRAHDLVMRAYESVSSRSTARSTLATP
jgi:hypothetical protein